MNLPEAIAHLVQIGFDDTVARPGKDANAAREIIKALKTRDGAKACTEHVWAEIGEPAAAEPARPPSALELVAAERERVVNVEGFDAAHDDKHTNEELARAAACYALDPVARIYPTGQGSYRRAIWPFGEEWWNPTPADRERELVKAAALCIAEIERLRRTKPNTS